jgi:hypothetical protein
VTLLAGEREAAKCLLARPAAGKMKGRIVQAYFRGDVLMSLESNIGAPVEKISIQAILPPGACPALECPEFPPAPVAQARAIETVFAQEQESQAVAGLLGLWTSSMLLHDMLAEHLSPPADEELPPRAKPRRQNEEGQ